MDDGVNVGVFFIVYWYKDIPLCLCISLERY